MLAFTWYFKFQTCLNSILDDHFYNKKFFSKKPSFFEYLLKFQFFFFWMSLPKSGRRSNFCSLSKEKKMSIAKVMTPLLKKKRSIFFSKLLSISKEKTSWTLRTRRGRRDNKVSVSIFQMRWRKLKERLRSFWYTYVVSRDIFLCLVHLIFGFWFLVTFAYTVTKILHNLCWRVARQDTKKITLLKWPKY